MDVLQNLSCFPEKNVSPSSLDAKQLIGVVVLFSAQPDERPTGGGKGSEKDGQGVEMLISLNGGVETKVTAWSLKGSGPDGEGDGMTGPLFDSLKAGFAKSGAVSKSGKHSVWVAALPAVDCQNGEAVSPAPSGCRVVQIARRFVHENLRGRITMKETAREAGVSMQHFCRVFSKETGMPFTQYVALMRTQKACELLRDTKKSIKEVAYEAGFGSIAQFNRQFKRVLAVSPTLYREQLES